jgi:adenylate cyclase
MSTEARESWRTALAYALGGAALTLGLVTGFEHLAGPVLPRLEGLFLDAAFRFRHRQGLGPPCDPRLVPVRIERESIQHFGRWPWPRSVHARILREGAGPLRPRGVVYDVLFRGESEDAEDAALADALTERGNVGLAVGVAMTDDPGKRLRRERVFGDPAAVLERTPAPRPGFPTPTEWVKRLHPPLEAFSRAAAALGHIRPLRDADGVYRRIQPFVVVDDRVLPSLAVVGACMALGVPVENASVVGRELVIEAGGDLKATRRIPLAADGSMLIDWAAPYGEGFAPLRALQLLNPEDPVVRSLAEDRLWLVGMAGLELDQGPTPLSDGDIPLFETHLHAMNGLVTGRSLRQVEGLPWLLSMLALGLLIPLPATRLGPLGAGVTGALGYLAYPALALGLFAGAGWVLAVAPWLVGATGAYLGTMLFVVLRQERARLRLEENFARFFSRRVVDKIMRDPEGAKLGGKRAELTILFSDIKGFTNTSEKIEPDVLGAFLGEYFERMVEIVFQHQGTVDKFMGDGLMAFWNDPEPLEDHAGAAVRAALEMQEAADALSQEWADRLDGPFQIRIGINTGRVTVGNMGGRRRMDYTVLGRSVNQAQRLEASADPGGILIGERTRNLLGDGARVGDPIEGESEGGA